MSEVLRAALGAAFFSVMVSVSTPLCTAVPVKTFVAVTLLGAVTVRSAEAGPMVTPSKTLGVVMLVRSTVDEVTAVTLTVTVHEANPGPSGARSTRPSVNEKLALARGWRRPCRGRTWCRHWPGSRSASGRAGCR